MKHESEPGSLSPRHGWVLYDGACGFCFRWVHFWRKTLEANGFALQDLQSAYDDGSVTLPPENLLDDVRVLLRNGDLVSGADAYLYVAKHIWWAWPFYTVFHLPGLNRVFWWGYRWFNRNRYRISRHCPLPEAGVKRRVR